MTLFTTVEPTLPAGSTIKPGDNAEIDAAIAAGNPGVAGITVNAQGNYEYDGVELTSSGGTTKVLDESKLADYADEIDTMEFQLALNKASIANLPPWDVDELVNQMDLNNDGKLDLPELDLALMSLSSDSGGEEE